jgi:ankyrin repeat protein
MLRPIQRLFQFYGITPLHLAAMSGNMDVVGLLLLSKGDVNATDDKGWTPLHYAAANSSDEVAGLLLANKAEVNAKDKNGTTPLALAVTNGNNASAHDRDASGYRRVAELLQKAGGQQ